MAAESELRDLVERYATDRAALTRRYPDEHSPERFARFKRFYQEWKGRMEAVPFEPLGVEGRIDHVLLRSDLDYELRRLEREEGWQRETAPLLPFAPAIIALNDARLRMESMDAAKAAAALDALAAQVEAARKAVEAAGSATADRTIAFRAQEDLADLKKTLESWYQFYAGYDPLFTWWAAAPCQKVSQALDDDRASLREKVLGIKKGEDDARGAAGRGQPRARLVRGRDEEGVARHGAGRRLEGGGGEGQGRGACR